jgi:hypothetical protein
MKVKMKEDRLFPDIGLKRKGEVIEVDENLGKQLISQGFAGIEKESSVKKGGKK